WSPTDSLSCNNCKSTDSWVTDTTNYQIIASKGNCYNDTGNITVNVFPKPKNIDAGKDTSICKNDTIQLNAVTDGFPHSWSPSSGLSDDSSNTPLAYPDSNTNYILEVTDSNECKTWDTTNINVMEVLISANLTLKSSRDKVCKGDTTQLHTIASQIRDDFNPGITGTFWSEINNGEVNQDCGSISDNSLKFDGNGTRQAKTIELNTNECDSIGFCLKIADGKRPCENADEGEDVVLEYSLDSGSTWTTMKTFLTTEVITWECFNLKIPSVAKTSETVFRWRQTKHNGNGFDHWALDNISLSCLNTSSGLLSWEPTTGLSDTTIPDPIATIDSSISYIVQFT
ncbi:MAG: hypothetical protein ABEH43_07010, partial [Flavobacteriales bacterium]